MSQERLWAPWRLAYVKASPRKEPPGCFLCNYLAESRDAENFVVSRTALSLTVLNRFPYNNGHLLVAPQAHKAGLEELTPDELADGMLEVQRMTALLGRVLNAEGFNIGLNLGRAAGAGLPGHLHWHIVPRWSGDTNFMSVVGDVKVIPQSLEALYELLQQETAGRNPE